MNNAVRLRLYENFYGGSLLAVRWQIIYPSGIKIHQL